MNASFALLATILRIVLPSNPSDVERTAAEELQNHLGEVRWAADWTFRLGRMADLSIRDLPANAVRIRIGDRVVDIAGVDGEGVAMNLKTPCGTLFGVYDFLERECGVRWLWPGELGTLLPEPSLAAPTGGERTVKAWPYADWRKAGADDSVAWLDPQTRRAFRDAERRWLRRHRFTRVGADGGGHAFIQYFQDFGSAHPDWFNLLPDGSRRSDPYYFGRPDLISMCTSSEGLADEIIRRQWNPNNGELNISENDTAGKCCCEACLKANRSGLPDGGFAEARRRFAAGDIRWYESFGSVSARYVEFWNRLHRLARERHPERPTILGGMIYANCSEPPPAGMKLEGETLLRFCPPMMYPWTPAKVAHYRAAWRGWADTGAKLLLRPNYTLDGHGFPLAYYRRFAACYAEFSARSCCGVDLCALTGAYGANGMTLYVIASLVSKRQTDVATLENEYCSAFGSSASVIREIVNNFVAATERGYPNGWKEPPQREVEGGDFRRFVKRAKMIFPDELLALAIARVDEAVGTERDRMAVRRLEFVRAGLEDARLVQRAEDAFVRSKNPKGDAAFAAAYGELARFRRAHARLGYANPAFLHQMEMMNWPRSVCEPILSVSAAVDPRIGTGSVGHCFPAASTPFGLVQAGPDTGNGDWKHCSGYHVDDGEIWGFTQDHLNGTGCGDLQDVLIMPFTGQVSAVEQVRMVKTNCVFHPFASAYDPRSERVSPGSYEVRLKSFGVEAAATATKHVGVYRFRYTSGTTPRLLVDLQNAVSGVDPQTRIRASSSRLDDDRMGLCGTNSLQYWVWRAYGHSVRFSVPYTKVEELPPRPGELGARYVFDFKLGWNDELMVKVALSAEGSVETAKANMEREAPGWDFAEYRSEARGLWNRLLDRVELEAEPVMRTCFYTALYHAFLQPNEMSDAGAQKPFYSTFSTWDTFRAVHPLYTIICPEVVPAMVDSLLEQGRRSGFLPVWALWGRDNQCMIATHSIPIVIDAVLKGLWPKTGSAAQDAAARERAYGQVRETLTKPHPQRHKERWDLIDKYGYLPCDIVRGESVSRLLESSYDDACASRFAALLGHTNDVAFFEKRANNWRNVFDSSLGLMRGRRSDGSWRDPFDPFAFGHGMENENDFTEGNAWQYTWHVLQDPSGLIDAMGGKERFVKQLDRLFILKADCCGEAAKNDITGLIGQYVHGNEQSHHIPYLYTLSERPDRTAEVIREICERFYTATREGLCGNDDCGQMSAWYVFAVLGFYPLDPTSGEYVLGAPQAQRAVLHLTGGRTFEIKANGFSRENKYVSEVRLNGKRLDRPIIRHSEIMGGGVLEFVMANRP